jgi:hypothetical protein
VLVTCGVVDVLVAGGHPAEQDGVGKHQRSKQEKLVSLDSIISTENECLFRYKNVKLEPFQYKMYV